MQDDASVNDQHYHQKVPVFFFLVNYRLDESCSFNLIKIIRVYVRVVEDVLSSAKVCVTSIFSLIPTQRQLLKTKQGHISLDIEYLQLLPKTDIIA
jgi:hypothetical protein